MSCSIRSVALVIVDMMNDHIHPDGVAARYFGGLSAADRALVVGNNQRLLRAARAAGRPVVHVRNEYRWDGLDCGTTEARVRQRPKLPNDVPHKIIGTWGAQFIDELAPAADELVLVKKNQSAFWFSPLDQMLRRLGVRLCIASGGAATGCLNDTVREGVGCGYELVVPVDAVYQPAHRILPSLEPYAALMTTDQALAMLLSAGESLARVGR